MDVAGRPKVPESPLEALNTPGLPPGLINQYYTPVVGAFICVLGVIGTNAGTRRPVFSGLPKHIIAGALGGAGGWWFDRYRNNHLAERDAIFRHYVELHPDDFPPYERKKFKDILEQWVPIR